MNFFKSLFNRKKSDSESLNSDEYNLGLEALKIGNRFMELKDDKGALYFFDKAILFGVNDAYSKRALCLYSLNFNIDAILDFDVAIELNPNGDSNLYFCRGGAKEKIEDYRGARSDYDLAVKYAKLEDEINDDVNKARTLFSKSVGFSSYGNHLEQVCSIIPDDFLISRQTKKEDLLEKAMRLRESGNAGDIELAEDLEKNANMMVIDKQGQFLARR